MDLDFIRKILICFLISSFYFVNIKSAKQTFNNSNNESKEEEKRFIKCLEENSLTSCLILLFINERQEKLLLQVQNELSKKTFYFYLPFQNLIN